MQTRMPSRSVFSEELPPELRYVYGGEPIKLESQNADSGRHHLQACVVFRFLCSVVSSLKLEPGEAWQVMQSRPAVHHGLTELVCNGHFMVTLVPPPAAGICSAPDDKVLMGRRGRAAFSNIHSVAGFQHAGVLFAASHMSGRLRLHLRLRRGRT